MRHERDEHGIEFGERSRDFPSTVGVDPFDRFKEKAFEGISEGEVTFILKNGLFVLLFFFQKKMNSPVRDALTFRDGIKPFNEFLGREFHLPKLPNQSLLPTPAT